MWKPLRFWYYGFHCACLCTEHCGTPAAQPPSVHQTAQPASCTVCLGQCRITAPLFGERKTCFMDLLAWGKQNTDTFMRILHTVLIKMLIRNFILIY